MGRKSTHSKAFTLIELMLALGSPHRSGPRTANVDPQPTAVAPPTVVAIPAYPRRKSGFTLIELMLVVAIIGLLAAIAIPKFGNLVIKSKEASIKGQMGTIRGALRIYYADNEGIYPNSGYGLPKTSLITGGKYLDGISVIRIPTVSGHTGAPQFSNNVVDGFFTNIGTGGEWAYFFATGWIAVNCTHTDSGGITWSRW